MTSAGDLSAIGIICGVLAMLLGGCGTSEPLPPACTPSGSTPKGDDVSVYFGCGCFWHMQHAFVTTEMSELCREGESITARCGYAGGTRVGPGGLVCYHNMMNKADYGSLGHAEVVSLTVPRAAFGNFTAKFWHECGGGLRRDPQDAGGEYRSVIGLPGGMNSSLLEEVRKHAGDVKLVAGQGDEGDTIDTGSVLVYDTAVFTAHVAEKYHQFHDDMIDAYGKPYNALQKFAEQTSCPGDQSVLFG